MSLYRIDLVNLLICEDNLTPEAMFSVTCRVSFTSALSSLSLLAFYYLSSIFPSSIFYDHIHRIYRFSCSLGSIFKLAILAKVVVDSATLETLWLFTSMVLYLETSKIQTKKSEISCKETLVKYSKRRKINQFVCFNFKSLIHENNIIRIFIVLSVFWYMSSRHMSCLYAKNSAFEESFQNTSASEQNTSCSMVK